MLSMVFLCLLYSLFCFICVICYLIYQNLLGLGLGLRLELNSDNADEMWVLSCKSWMGMMWSGEGRNALLDSELLFPSRAT